MGSYKGRRTGTRMTYIGPSPGFSGPSRTWKWLRKSCKRSRVSEIKVWPQGRGYWGRAETWNGMTADHNLNATCSWISEEGWQSKEARVSKQEERSLVVKLNCKLHFTSRTFLECLFFYSRNGRTECCLVKLTASNWKKPVRSRKHATTSNHLFLKCHIQQVNCGEAIFKRTPPFHKQSDWDNRSLHIKGKSLPRWQPSVFAVLVCLHHFSTYELSLARMAFISSIMDARESSEPGPKKL